MPDIPEWIDRESRRLARERGSREEILSTFRAQNGVSSLPLRASLERDALAIRCTSRRPMWLPLVASIARTILGVVPTIFIVYVLSKDWLTPTWNGVVLSPPIPAAYAAMVFCVFLALVVTAQAAGDIARHRYADREDESEMHRQISLFFIRSLE